MKQMQTQVPTYRLKVVELKMFKKDKSKSEKVVETTKDTDASKAAKANFKRMLEKANGQ